MTESTEALPSEPPADDMQEQCPPPQHFDVGDLTSPIITLEVGPDATPLTAHKAILARCSYFAKCLESDRFEEGVHNRIKLPDETPQDLVKLLGYLYTGRLYAGDRSSPLHTLHLDATDATAAIMDLIGLFVIGDKFCCETMCDKVAEIIDQNAFILPQKLSFCHLEKMYDQGLRGVYLWNTLMRHLARGFLHPVRRIDLLRLFEEGLGSTPEIASDLLKEIGRVVKDIPTITCCKDHTGCTNCGAAISCNCEFNSQDPPDAERGTCGLF